MRTWQLAFRMVHLGAMRTAVLLCAWLAGAPIVSAQTEPKLPLNELQRIAVPDDDPKNWPFRDQKQEWTEFNRDDYLLRLSRLLAPPEVTVRPHWRHARYAAILVGDTLTNGRLTANLQTDDSPARFVPLGNPSVAIEELSWSGAPALWGTGLDGRHWLRRAPESETLEGRWSARGRPLQTGVAFDLQLLSAAITELEVQTPTGQTITSDVGDVELISPGSSPDWLTWRISLGDQARCRLVVSAQAQTGVSIPTMLYDHELAVTIGQEEMQLGQTFLVELLGGDVSRLTVSMPRAVEIVSVSSVDQTPLAFERIHGEGPSSQVVVTLPADAAGRLRSFRLDGFLRRAPGEPFAVPQFILEGGLWMKGRVNVTISRPMELRSYRSPGYRQTVAPSKPADGEMVSFQQLLPRAQLLLNVDRPHVERLAHILNQLTVGPRLWTLTAEVAWESRNGTVFEAACRIPDDWQVLSVVRLGGGRESQETTDWQLEPHPDSGQTLTLEFPDGLTPGRVDSVRIITQRDIGSVAVPTTVPIVTPIDCEFSEVLLQTDRRWNQQLELSSHDQLETFNPRSAATVWNTLPAWSSALDESGETVLLQVIHPEAAIPLTNAGGSSQVKVAVDLEIKLRESQVVERYEVRLQNLADSERFIELKFAETTPGIRWSAVDAPELELPTQHRSAAESGADGTAEISVITLPNRETDQVLLIGVREVGWSGEHVIPVLVVPQAGSFTGHIRLTPESEEIYVLSDRDRTQKAGGSSPADPVDAVISDAAEWTYQQADRAWHVRSKGHESPQNAQVAYRLRSVLTGNEQGYDYHELSIRPLTPIKADGLSFRLSPSAEFLAAWSDERTLEVSRDGEVWTIVDGRLISDRSELVLTYRIATASLFWSTRHPFELPQLPGTCAGFTWQVSVPKTWEFRRAPLALPMTPGPTPSNWWHRLCGPLSQPPAAETVRLASSRSLAAADALQLDRDVWGDANSSPWKISPPAQADLYYVSSPELPNQSSFLVWNQTATRLTTWLCLFCCLPAGWLLRRSQGLWRSRLMSLLLGLSASLAVFGPEGWNEFSGGIFNGLMISLLLPIGPGKFAQPVVWPTHDRSASTEIFRRSAVPFGLWLVFSTTASWIFAQSDSASPGAPVRGPKIYRVLMPVDQSQQPSKKLPVVYVSSDLRDALLAAPPHEDSDPQQLIVSAEYLLYQDQNRRQMFRIQYHIAGLEQESQRILQVPLAPVWRRNLESCFVDEQPQLATTSPDENSLLIPLPTDLASKDRHVIRLEIPLPKSMNPQSEELRGALFPALNSHLKWRSSEPISHVLFPQARGSLSISLDRRLLEAQLGAVSEVSLKQTSVESLSAHEGRTELNLLQIMTLRPMLTQMTFRVECRVLEGAVHRLEADLPPGAVLRGDLRAHQELQSVVVPLPDGGMKTVIEFSEPQRQDFVVEGEYILPRASLEEVVELPRLQVRSGISGSVKQSVAVAYAPEFTGHLINPEDPAVLPIPVDTFFTHWGDTFPNQRPQFAFQVQEGGRPLYRLSTVQSEQQVVRWHENVTLSRKGLDWELRADLKSTAWPAYSFSMLLDRRLTLDTVSVTENGVDLLARTSKTPMIRSSQNRLTLFLNRETSGTCQIRIHGTIRFRPTSAMVLPTVRFETPKSVPGTLALYHETGYRLQLEGKPMEFGTDVPSGELLPDQPHLQLFKQFRLLEGDTGLTARLEPVSGACTVQTLWVIDSSASPWRVRGWMELTPDDGTREVKVLLPDWLRQSPVAVVPGDFLPLEAVGDGQPILTVNCSGRESTAQVLQWDLTLPVVGESMVSLKLPTVPQARQQSDLAAVFPSDSWTISDGSVVGVNGLPVLVREQLTQWQAESIESLIQLSNQTLPLRRVAADSPVGRSSVVLLTHELREQPDGVWLGESTFYPRPGAGLVELILPGEFETMALVTDGLFVPVSSLSENGTLWRVLDAARFQRLSVRWKSPGYSKPWHLAAGVTLPLPVCRQEQPPQTYVAVVDLPQSWLIFPRQFHRGTTADFALDALEMEIQRHRSSSGEGDANTGQRIWMRYRAAAEQLADAKLIARLSEDDRRRWEGIVQFVNQLQETSPRQDEPVVLADRETFAAVDSDARIGILTSDVSELSYWSIRRPVVAGLATVLLMLGCLWLLPGIMNWLLSPGGKHHRQAVWLLFGVVWWICWSPKIVALAMIAWALVEWLQKRRTQLTIASQS